ncbi:MAG: endonuclease/exonuclease/phosphatase family protein [Anaerolineales bacterium]
MEAIQSEKIITPGRIVLPAILAVFFIQLLTDFIEAIYAFGLLGTGIPVEILAVVLFFSPLLLVLAGRRFPEWGLLGAGLIVILARPIEVMLNTRPRMLVSGIGVAAFLVYLPAFLWVSSQKNRREESGYLSLGALLGVLFLILMRAVHSGLDRSTEREFLIIGWILALFGSVFLFTRFRESLQSAGKPDPQLESNFHRKKQLFWQTTCLSLGVSAVFLLYYFGFSSPNVFARWTAASYSGVMLLTLFSYALFAALMALPWFRRFLKPVFIWVWNVLFILSLVLTILANQIQFPAENRAYPLYEPAPHPLNYLPLVLMLALSPVLMADLYLYLREILQIKPSLRELGIGFGAGALFLLLMSLAHVFTTVYGYIPVIGPFFRDKFWLVYAAAGIGLSLPMLFVDRKAYIYPSLQVPSWTKHLITIYILAVGVVSVFSVYRAEINPSQTAPGESYFTVLSYNIQQGYSASGQKNHTEQLGLMRSLNPDIIGLQETDTNRLSGGNADLVRYFADNLGMHAYYGPKTVLGTFGIALLSRYPIENPRTFYMFSDAEQTATIHARVSIGNRGYNIYVTHLGNGGPLIQQQEIMEEASRAGNVILMGDFNFEPETEQYRLTTDVFKDAWLLRWPEGVDDQGFAPARRIDNVFLSEGMSVVDVRYIDHPASDHPALVVTIERR